MAIYMFNTYRLKMALSKDGYKVVTNRKYPKPNTEFTPFYKEKDGKIIVWTARDVSKEGRWLGVIIRSGPFAKPRYFSISSSLDDENHYGNAVKAEIIAKKYCKVIN